MKNITSTVFALGLTCVAGLFTSGCSYQLPNSYEAMKDGREKDSITYLYRCHVTYGATLFATDTINLFTRAGKQSPSFIATQGDTLTVLDFRAITKNKKDKVEEVWALVNVAACGATKHFSAWLPARELTNFCTTPDRWTRYMLPAPFLKRNISFRPCAPYLIPFAVLLLFELIYVIIIGIQKKRKLTNTANSGTIGLLFTSSIITGIILFCCLMFNKTTVRHFYYSPDLFSWGELPLLMILLIVLSTATIVMTVFSIVGAFYKFKWQKAIFHAFGYLSISVSVVSLTIVICTLVYVIIYLVFFVAIGICILIWSITALSTALPSAMESAANNRTHY
jgi:hypothetical protein